MPVVSLNKEFVERQSQQAAEQDKEVGILLTKSDFQRKEFQLVCGGKVAWTGLFWMRNYLIYCIYTYP
jgi:hypothetical protein